MADARSTQTEQKLEVVEKEASLVSESKVAKVPIRCSPGKVAVDTDIGETDRALTKYFNRISWTDLKIHEFTVIRMETLQLQTMEEEVLFHEKVHMKLIERALTSPPEIAHMLANVCAAIHEEPTRTFVDPITRMVQRKELDLFLMRIVNFVVAAACLWVNHPTRIKKWTQALDKKTINKLSKFFHQVSENQFSRVAWFVCCLRNCGIAVPMHLHLIHIELLVQPMCYYEQGPRKLSFLRRYLKMLEKTTVESGGIGQWNEDVENPLYCEENVGYPSLTKLRRLIEARANADATQRKQEALKYIETVLMNKLRQEEWNVKTQYEELENAKLLINFAQTGQFIVPPKTYICGTCSKEFSRLFKCRDCNLTSCADCILMFHQHQDRRYPQAFEIFDDAKFCPPAIDLCGRVLDFANGNWVKPANPNDDPIPSGIWKFLLEIRDIRLSSVTEQPADESNRLIISAPSPMPISDGDESMPLLEKEVDDEDPEPMPLLAKEVDVPATPEPADKTQKMLPRSL
ncbi:hypothetical protein QR680_004059 [Steinernema hermaphroditum]|uniref:Uncharacterized protein n=1 Tax=Steinernema hermaphroditum TaxID=289476 RepID=A0AA39LTD5_9BILA|nr:hypothetical protein QR680_004059 [Steinernema hermaphroditum]